MIIFSAPSGSGKTTIVKRLLKDPKLNLAFSISATSRDRRGTEEHGKDYYFLSPAEFEGRIESSAFMEWEEVYKDNYYGTLKSEVERLWDQGKHVVFDIDVVGGRRLKNNYPDQTLAIFVKAPSLEEMEKRLRDRKTDSEEKIKERVAKASREMEFAKDFDRILVNDDLDQAVEQATQMVSDFVKEA